MKLVYGISRWTSVNSNKKLHIPNQAGQPICVNSGSPYRQHTYESVEADKPTCKRCLALLGGKQ